MYKFKAFKVGGVQYLAVPKGESGNVHVIDDAGNNYGSWMSVENFVNGLKGKANMNDGTCVEATKIGTATLRVVSD